MTLCVASQRVFTVVSVYFVINSVLKLLDTPSYNKLLDFTNQTLLEIKRNPDLFVEACS
jgi:hypothetical protein